MINSMENPDKKAFIFAGMFALANRLQVLGDKMDENITIKQWLLMAVVSKYENASPSLGEVADIIGNSRQSIKKMAVILEKQGFVKLQQDANDKRILRIELTKKCKVYFEIRTPMEFEFFDRLFAGFDDTLLQGLFDGICKLNENIMHIERQIIDEE